MMFGFSWVLLHWKVKVFNRPLYSKNLKVRTWGGYYNKFYTLRDFEIYDENNNLVCIASSKWALVDVNTKSISRITPYAIDRYECETKTVFGENDIPKIKVPEILGSPCYTFKVLKRDIDINNHMNNVHYLDYALEALPEDAYTLDEANELEIMYKSGAKLGSTVNCYYTFYENNHYVVMKNEDGSQIHAIVKFA